MGDTAFAVTEVEWERKPVEASSRIAEARRLAAVAHANWPDPRLRQIAVAFERPLRLGPLQFDGIGTRYASRWSARGFARAALL
jgi:hypothetical protein